MEKIITFFGQKAKVGCDEQCHKAYGINLRPKVQLSADEDDFAWLADSEVPDAPEDPETYEGEDAKPLPGEPKGNRWCVRQCERCVMSELGESDKPLVLKDFSKRIFNKHARREKGN